MANKLYEEEDIRDIANAIREVSGGSDTYTVSQMGGAVRTFGGGAAESAAAAAASAAEAAASASTAKTSETNAATSASAASNSASAAKTSETNAANSATSAQHAAAEVQEAVNSGYGATFTPSVDANGNLSWTNDKGRDNPATVNIKGPKGDAGAAGVPGAAGVDGKDGSDYVLTSADRAEIAEMVDGATIVQAPKHVNSIDEMTDTERVYVLASTGEIWAYMDTTTTEEVTVKDVITGHEQGRLGSDGSNAGDNLTTHTVTPYIDLTKPEYVGKTIELHLDGNRYVSETAESNIYFMFFDASKTKMANRANSCLDKSTSLLPVLTNVKTVINGTTSATMTITIPAKYNGKDVSYLRFSGLGQPATADVYITYKEIQTVVGGKWVNTGTTYAPILSDEEKQAIVNDVAAMVDAQLLTLVGDGAVTV